MHQALQALNQDHELKNIGITDQQALHELIQPQGPMPAAPEDDHMLLMRNGTLRVHALPVLLFANGHVAFVQRLPWRSVVQRPVQGQGPRAGILQGCAQPGLCRNGHSLLAVQQAGGQAQACL